MELQTDQNAAYMQAGDLFDIPLTVTVVPEPSLMAIVVAAASFTRRRRRD